jgi:hypothetical protein
MTSPFRIAEMSEGCAAPVIGVDYLRGNQVVRTIGGQGSGP